MIIVIIIIIIIVMHYNQHRSQYVCGEMSLLQCGSGHLVAATGWSDETVIYAVCSVFSIKQYNTVFK